MYAGDYLASNLGHEIINLFQADNGWHYLYLNSSGNLSNEHEGIDVMLLVKAHSTDTFEVIGMARGLHLAPGATMTMPRDISREIAAISSVQKEYIETEGVTYGGISILDIFKNTEQQNIFITYKADKVYVPSGFRIFLQYGKNTRNTHEEKSVTVVLCCHNMPRTSLKSYIYPDSGSDGNSDYDNIMSHIVENSSLWTDKVGWKPLANGTSIRHRVSLFDICRMRDDENRISNALAYFMLCEQYKSLWIKFFSIYNIRLNNDYTVDREVSAKITDANINIPSGGRIDILIKDNVNFVVIENKIKSDINSVQTDQEGENQLHRYINYAQHITTQTGQSPHFLIIAPNYNVPQLESKTERKYQIITYRDICQFLNEPANMEIIESDSNFLALYDVMKWHTFDTSNEYLYYEMMEKFEERLKNATTKSLVNNKSTLIDKNNKKMAKSSAISGEYIITQEDNDTIRVCQIFDNVKDSLREAAKAVGFEFDPNWTTRQFGNKLVKEYGDGHTASVGEYTIVKRDSGSVESYRVHGNTIAALRKIAKEIGLTADSKWNTRTFGRVLIDFVNGDYNPNEVVEDESGLSVIPDMTVQQLWDAFHEMFGGHLRIKKGNKRYDAHYNSTDGSHHDVIDVALSEIGCNASGKFSPELTVGEFTKKMKDECGLSVVVATSDDWVAVLDDYVLDSVSFIPKNTTKAKMQEILDR